MGGGSTARRHRAGWAPILHIDDCPDCDTAKPLRALISNSNSGKFTRGRRAATATLSSTRLPVLRACREADRPTRCHPTCTAVFLGKLAAVPRGPHLGALLVSPTLKCHPITQGAAAFFERGACTFDFGEYLGALGSPYVKPWVGVSLDEIGVDVADQRADRAGSCRRGSRRRSGRRRNARPD